MNYLFSVSWLSLLLSVDYPYWYISRWLIVLSVENTHTQTNTHALVKMLEPWKAGLRPNGGGAGGRRKNGQWVSTENEYPRKVAVEKNGIRGQFSQYAGHVV